MKGHRNVQEGAAPFLRRAHAPVSEAARLKSDFEPGLLSKTHKEKTKDFKGRPKRPENHFVLPDMNTSRPQSTEKPGQLVSPHN